MDNQFPEKLNNPISQKVVQRIKIEKICPKPKWCFQIEKGLLVFFFAAFLAISALVVSLILDLADEIEPSSIISRPRGIKLALVSFPYFWLAVLMFFAALAIADFYRTKDGYRYSLQFVAVVFSFSALILGILIYAFGVAGYAHSFIRKNATFYHKIVPSPRSLWTKPEEGLLSGVVIHSDSEGCHCMEIVGWSQEFWNVNYAHADISSDVHLRMGESVKIIGKKEGDGIFNAEKISPWERGFMKIMDRKEEKKDVYLRILEEARGRR